MPVTINITAIAEAANAITAITHCADLGIHANFRRSAITGHRSTGDTNEKTVAISPEILMYGGHPNRVIRHKNNMPTPARAAIDAASVIHAFR